MKRVCVAILIALSFILSACGPKSPSDDEFSKVFTTKVSGVQNVKVVGKTHCDTISDQSKALGATNVWLVGFEYDLSSGEHRKMTETLIESGSDWKLGDFDFNLPSDKCP